MDGVLIVDKPSGPTSHDVVARVRRALKEKRIGHTGTLDPLATGVLALVIGRATRLASLLSSDRKSYIAGVRLGCATPTYDAAERLDAGLAPPPAPPVTTQDIEPLLADFRGTFLQAPPPYSAKKIGGVAAHRLARRDKAVQPASVEVTVDHLELLGLADGLLRLEATASAGFYVRSLAHDLGQRLGCGAHLESLRRTAAGTLTVDQAVPLERIEADPAAAIDRMIPLERLAPHIPAVQLTEEGARKASHGNSVGPGEIAGPDLSAVALAKAEGSGLHAGRVRMLDPTGRLLGIAEATGGVLRPVVVLV